MRTMTKLILSALVLLSPMTGFTQLSNSQRALVPFKNELTNPGGETGKAGWSNSGGTFSVTTTSPIEGSSSFSWDPSATSQYVQQVITVPGYLKGGNCLARIQYTGFDSLVTLKAYDGSNTLASLVLSAAASRTAASVSFPCPSSGSFGIRLESTGNAAVGKWEAYLGDNYLIGTEAQPQFLGTVSFAATAACQHLVAGGTYTSFSADSDCPTPTVTNVSGNYLSAPATKIPGFQVGGGGNIFIKMSGVLYAETATSNGCDFRFTDGTNNSDFAGFAPAKSDYFNSIAAGNLSLSSASTLTVQLQAKRSSGGSGNCGDNVQTSNQVWEIWRFPTSSETVARSENIAQSWSGYHDSTCSWGVSGTSISDFPTGDATCGFSQRTNTNIGTVTSTVDGSSNKLDGITWTPAKTGTYFVCGKPKVDESIDTATVTLQLTDGSNTVIDDGLKVDNGGFKRGVPLCGLYNVASVGSSVSFKIRAAASSGSVTIATAGASVSAVEWSIVNITQSMNMPVIVGSVSTSSAGQERIERVSFGGGSEPSACTAGSCTIYTSTPGISGVTWSATGTYSVGFAAGTFTSKPTCTFNPYGSVNTYALTTAAVTTSAWALITRDTNTQAATNSGGQIICMGPR